VAGPVKVTSVTFAVHLWFGHDPAGACGVADVTVKTYCPFLGVRRGPEAAVTSVVKVCRRGTYRRHQAKGAKRFIWFVPDGFLVAD
jgi:hypothetical protein